MNDSKDLKDTIDSIDSIDSNDFVHLHVHTEFSLLDGAVRLKNVASKLKEMGMQSMAITDHGAMYGVVDFYNALKNEGLKPIIGCEVYVAPRSRLDKEGKSDESRGHMILLAKNEEGYKNLIKIVSVGFTEGFYYKPRVDFEVLQKHSNGIIALSACLSGEIPTKILANDYEGAKALALRYAAVFGEGNFYLEVQDHGIPDQRIVNTKLIEISKETGIPLVATNDAHYMNRDDAKAHEVLLCIQTGKTINDDDRMRFETEEFYLKSAEEMKKLFQHVPEAIENTVKIAEMCNFDFNFKERHLPTFEVPQNYEPFEYLRHLCVEGLRGRYGNLPTEEQVDRLNFELNVIKDMGFVDYFLIVWDFIAFAKAQKIMVGPGRGSAAGSVVAYCLGITGIDPLEFNLVFERFLNPARVSMPDIDIDFCFERRQEVIDYVIRKYGDDHVAQIITFGTLAARAAVKDTGRALAVPYSEVDRIAKQIPMKAGITLDEALTISADLKESYESSETIKNLIDTALKFEGMPRHSSTHAAGVVITAKPVTEYVPVSKQDNCVTTQFNMNLLEKLGLLKMDFLGLRTLTVIRDAIEMIKENHGIEIDIDNLELNDESVFKMIGEGMTAGVFQLESAGMTSFMKELQPTCIEDVIAGVSLYRPGPMEQIPKYIANKRSKGINKYDIPQLENIMEPTHGCIIYQEQVIQIVRDIAGFSMAQADVLRKAMSKKNAADIEKARDSFMNGDTNPDGTVAAEGALKRGASVEAANRIFNEIVQFGGYAFNKSHAAAYAVIAYQTGWLKRYYPTEFMAAMLNSFLGSAERIAMYVAEAKAMGIQVLPPDINESGRGFTVNSGRIRFGLAAVKNVGESAAAQMILERTQDGAFKSFRNFCVRMESGDVNKKCIESLIKSGAFDFEGLHRSQMCSTFEKMLDGIASSRRNQAEGQFSLFDNAQKADMEDAYYPDIKEYPKKLLLAMEKEMLGVFISGHPLQDYRDIVMGSDFTTSAQIVEMLDEEKQAGAVAGEFTDLKSMKVAGIVTSRRNKVTQKNNLMAFVTIEDLFGPIDLLVFPQILDKYSGLLEEEGLVIVEGNLSVREEQAVKLIAEKVMPLQYPEKSSVRIDSERLYLRFPLGAGPEIVETTHEILKSQTGKIPVYTVFEGEKTAKVLEKEFWITLDDIILSKLSEILGEANVKIKK